MTTILLIEDNEAMNLLVRNMLESDGYEVLSAGGLEEGVRLATENGATLGAALLDFWLDTKNAVPLIDHIAAKFPAVPIIMISGGGGGITLETTRAIGEVSGIVHFLPKPFRRAELLNLLRSVISAPTQ